MQTYIVEPEFRAMLYFLFPDEFFFLYVDADMPVYLVEVLGIDTAHVGVALSSYTIGLLCVRPFSGFLVDSFFAQTVISVCLFLYLLSCSAGICLPRLC